MTATADLLAFAAAEHRLPEAVRADTLRLLTDTLAVGAAGATAPGAEAILSVARAMGSGSVAVRILLGNASLPPARPSSMATASIASNGTRSMNLPWSMR